MSQVLTQYQVNGSNPSTVGGSGIGTSIAYFPNQPGPSIGVANVTPSATSAKGQLLVPGSNRLNGQPFHVLASGNFEVGAGGSSASVTITLRANTGTVSSPVYTTIAASNAFAGEGLDGVFYPWQMDVLIQGDSQSNLIQGSYTTQFDNAAVTSTTALNSSLSTLLPANAFANEPPFGLVLGVTFSASETGNSANLFNFALTA